ncbi:recQ-mediated genome instability protein 1 isoform X1 [Acanthochromis polyacanthus]|uniref:recQ-mediated genome instability protein 1 isoform X1 n=1 Tax=Acanthochromis polyacanthus TaxID=80966 RepID=UPI00223419A7|nr:recQ-mediated genome instability protein 1 isoform X1 [Acanthochromis polyacanthus]XP_022054772.2 recQ-mediated genome instability protein 1 isoform X1 [Acanthochromis polyacanthus]
MAPEIQVMVRTTQAWLQSSQHVQVPFAWLEACMEWLQEEAGGAARLSQQQINRQVLDQWLLTDLRDLDHPVLPEGLAQAQKTELNGVFCVQVDSLLDVSQPAYGQLQKWRGTDCANDDVSAVTQYTQRPWEARPTRMLVLQVTDGVQSLEAMECQPIPALTPALRPGAKLQLQGRIVCRLGMLLLGPSNIKILGGEVEDLVDRNSQGRVLCRTLGLPEEQQQEEEEAPPAPQQGNQDVEDLELDDAELLASLGGREDAEMLEVLPAPDSGYGTLHETSAQSSRSSSVRSFVSTTSSRSETSTHSYRRGLIQSNGRASAQGLHDADGQHISEADFLPPDGVHQEIQDDSMGHDNFPDEDFDDLPLDELDRAIFQESNTAAAQSDSSHRNTPQNNNRITGNPDSLGRGAKPQTAQFEPHTPSGNSRSTAQKRDYEGCMRATSGQLTTTAFKPFISPAVSNEFVTNNQTDIMDDDMDCFLDEVEVYEAGSVETAPDQLPVQQGFSKDTESAAFTTEKSTSSCRLSSKSSRRITDSHRTPQGQTSTSSTAGSDALPLKQDPQSDSTDSAVTLTSSPFTYLCLLEELMSKPHPHKIEIHVKAFIVTLVGKLSSINGVWSVSATVSDGTGYLDVELSNEVLTSLLGFSVAEKGALRRDPARRGELDAGMRRCQEELVDMCCIMTIVVEPGERKAVVTKANPVSEKAVQELEQRVKDRRK